MLCSGCGACAYINPNEIEMIDTIGHGRRPRLKTLTGDKQLSEEAMAVCPGVGLEHTFDPNHPDLVKDLVNGWGPIFGMWEGYANDTEIRHAGSSGGGISALSLYCIEKLEMHGVLHTAARSDVPYLNQTVISTSRDEILKNTGSRYAPASPCDGLQWIEDAPNPCVFVGKPCDVAATQRARTLRSTLDQKLGVTIAFFCAGTPTTEGTLEMLKRMGVPNPSKVIGLRYRGKGWPGKAEAVFQGDHGEESRQLTYQQSWGDILAEHVQWRCRICADHTGEFADIAVGDPWYRPIRDGDPGQSLIMARTKRGKEIIEGAIREGYLTAEVADPSILPASQPNLLHTRGAIWGRILTLRLLGIPAPIYKSMPMFRFWWSQLNLSQKFRSIVGTARRVFVRKLWQRRSLDEFVNPN